LSGKNKIVLGGFASLTIIQALVGILFTAIPPSSSESSPLFGIWISRLTCCAVVKPPSIPLDVFHICVFDSKTRYEIAYAWMSLLYGMIFTFSTLNSGYMPVYKPRRCCGVHFDRPFIPPRSGQDFDNCYYYFTGCHGLFPDNFYFPCRPGLLYHICEGKVRFPPVQRYLDSFSFLTTRRA